jgi:hypothetical protein
MCVGSKVSNHLTNCVKWATVKVNKSESKVKECQILAYVEAELIRHLRRGIPVEH